MTTMGPEQQVRAVFDQLGVPWDDPRRSLAIDFMSRSPEERMLWLWLEAGGHVKQSSMRGHLTTAVASIASSLALVAMAARVLLT